MPNRFWFALWSTGLLLLLTSCGEGSGSQSTNTSPGTQTSGPVSIATDHSIYGPTDHIQVTVLNTLSTAIYAFDTQASCSILGLEVQVNGTWQASSVARCSLGRPAMIVKIDPGKAYTTTIQADTSLTKDAVIPPGTYRLVLNYSTIDSAASLLSNPTTIFSAPFSVTGSPPPSPGTTTPPAVASPPSTP